MKKKTMAAACCLLILFLTAAGCGPGEKSGVPQDVPKDMEFGMFSWSEAALEESEAEELEVCFSEAGVGEIYQFFTEENLGTEETSGFLRRMAEQGIPVCALMGESEWSRETGGEALIREIRRIVEFNREADAQELISTVMVDVEPYVLEEWDGGDEERQQLMEDYLECMRSAYSYAQENDLRYIVCIPTFYDAVCPDILEKLVRDACDGIAVMNYNRSDEFGQMEAETELAREYEKEIICIFELQEAGKHELEEINTYAGIGLEDLWRSAETLRESFAYEGLRFAYHYYEPLKEMLQQRE